jgi:hypothetical protein
VKLMMNSAMIGGFKDGMPKTLPARPRIFIARVLFRVRCKTGRREPTAARLKTLN